MLKSCAVCGKEFAARNYRIVCCGSECSRVKESEYQHTYHAAHRDELREYHNGKFGREYYRTYQAAHREKRRESGRECQRRFRATGHGKLVRAADKHNRRCHEGIPLTAHALWELKEDRRGLCPYCGGEIVEGHFDHVIPVSKGGTNARENILWVCSRCNMQKGDKSLVDFLVGREEAMALPARRSEAEKVMVCPWD